MNAQTENILRRERLHAIKVRDARRISRGRRIPSFTVTPCLSCVPIEIIRSGGSGPGMLEDGARHLPSPPLPVAAPAWPLGRLVHVGVHLVLEDVQVVGGCDGDDVLPVPGRVQDLLGEVQAVHADVSPAVALPPTHTRSRLEHRLGLALPREASRVTSRLVFRPCHAEEVVVGSSHDDAGGRRRAGVSWGSEGRREGSQPPSRGWQSYHRRNGTPWEQTGTGRLPPLWVGWGVLLSPHHIWAASAHKLRAGS